MSSSPTLPRTRPTKRLLWLSSGILVVLLVLADLGTKWMAQSYLKVGEYHPLVGRLLGIRLTYNPGAAFSLGDGSTIFVTGLSILIAGAFIVLLIRAKTQPEAVFVAMVLSGALGNLYDRFFTPPYWGQGHVVDFIDYAGFFVGNVADIWIVVGVIGMMIVTAFLPRSRHKALSTEEDTRYVGQDSDDE